MMNTMKQEVESQENRVVRQEVVNVEEETMHPILQYRPNEVAQEETEQRFNECVHRHKGQSGKGK